MASMETVGGGPFDIVMIGHFSKDKIIAFGEEKEAPGGAVYYGSIPAARLGLRVAVVTKTAEADRPLLQPMRDAGVEVFQVNSEVTTSIENRYLDETLERRVCTPLAFAGAYGMEDIPGIESEIWHVGGLIKGETDLEMLKQLSTRGMLSVDAQGFVRVIRGSELVSEDWPEAREALPLIDFFKTDAAEAEALTGQSNIFSASDVLAEWGAREVILTHRGGLLVTTCGEQFNTPFTSNEIVGRTGRGDTTISAYLAWRLENGVEESARFAAALVSLKMEREGPFTGSLEAVLERMNEIQCI